MAKKRKRGRKKSKSQTKQKPQVREGSPVVYEKKKNVFSSIYNLSIGRVRIVALLLVIIGLILIILGGFSLYRAVKTQVDNNKIEEEESEPAEGEIEGGIQTEKGEEVAGTGDENGNGGKNEEGSSSSDEGSQVQEVSEGAKKARVASSNKSVYTGKWVATNYKPGDIKPGNYEVQRGDTLWEISEAVYGSGLQWHKILDANSSSVGFLPNGSQALIVPGQILVIPTV